MSLLPPNIATENACYALALSASNANGFNGILSIYKGFNNTSKTAPCVIVSATEARNEIHNIAIYRVKTDIIIKEIASDTTASNIGYTASTIYQAFLNGNNTIQFLNNTNSGSYYVYDMMLNHIVNEEEGDAWVQTLSFDIVCAV